MLQVKTVWTGVGGVPYYTNLNFSGADDISGATLVHDVVADAWNAFDTWIHVSLTWTVLPQVNFIDTATGFPISTYILPEQTGNGSDAADRLPHMAQGLVTWLTGDFIAGRQVKGRTFLPGPTEISNASTGLPTDPYKDNVAVLAGALTGAADPLVVWSRTHSSMHAVDGFSVGDNWAYLSSRRD